jgi:hypothetical protein
VKDLMRLVQITEFTKLTATEQIVMERAQRALDMPDDVIEPGEPSYAGFNFCPNCANRLAGKEGLHEHDGYTYCNACDPQ